MFIARWHFTALSGQTNKCLALVRRWVLEVASHIGWKPTSVRVVNGMIGTSEAQIELEAHFDEISDLEVAWKDLARGDVGKANEALMANLEPLMVSGTSRWDVYRVADIIPAD